ncbi:MAG: hypothetical protein ACLFRO_05075 [Desulfobacterales bacterium]
MAEALKKKSYLKTDHDTIAQSKDISCEPRGMGHWATRAMHPFKEKDPAEPFNLIDSEEARADGFIEDTVLDTMAYLLKIESMLSWKLVFSDCLKHGINQVGTDGGYCNMNWWKREFWGTYNGGSIDLNPHLNRAKVAERIKEQQGIEIEPEEVYYWIWFHEIGHAVHEKETREALRHQFNMTWGRKKPTDKDREETRNAHEIAERKANEYANRRFKEWKAGIEVESLSFEALQLHTAKDTRGAACLE